MVTRPGRVTPVLPPGPTKYKICLVGDPEVGKTQFCKAFKDQFSLTYEPTVGSDFYMKQMRIGKQMTHFNVWDLAGD